MRLSNWIGYNWFELVQTAVFVGALLLIALAFLLEARARRVGNLIQLTQAHRDLWERMYSQPELSRILDPSADLTKAAVKPEEEVFVIFLILQPGRTYGACHSSPHRLEYGEALRQPNRQTESRQGALPTPLLVPSR
jgi:hypothetical protein